MLFQGKGPGDRGPAEQRAHLYLDGGGAGGGVGGGDDDGRTGLDVAHNVGGIVHVGIADDGRGQLDAVLIGDVADRRHEVGGLVAVVGKAVGDHDGVGALVVLHGGAGDDGDLIIADRAGHGVGGHIDGGQLGDAAL